MKSVLSSRVRIDGENGVVPDRLGDRLRPGSGLRPLFRHIEGSVRPSKSEVITSKVGIQKPERVLRR